jgi:hypothetical protein
VTVTDLVALRAANERRFATAKITRNFMGVAQHLIAAAAKARYQALARMNGRLCGIAADERGPRYHGHHAGECWWRTKSNAFNR